MRYVERNAVRADFVELAEDWQWSSAFARRQPADDRRWLAISDEPPLPRNWRSWVNKVETEAELNSQRQTRRAVWQRSMDQKQCRSTWSRNYNTAQRSAQRKRPDRFCLPDEVMLRQNLPLDRFSLPSQSLFSSISTFSVVGKCKITGNQPHDFQLYYVFHIRKMI